MPTNHRGEPVGDNHANRILAAKERERANHLQSENTARLRAEEADSGMHSDNEHYPDTDYGDTDMSYNEPTSYWEPGDDV